ncbi:MAG: hypothetical protein H6835_08275 [Planctomycetes bacterium]|nr:hypothetical protein [Planctomycetota bacterium]
MNYLLAALAASSLFLSVPHVAKAEQGPSVTAAKTVGDPKMAVGPNVLTSGSMATITYSDPSRAGQTILVTIDNGMRRTPEVQTVEIVLNENGVGTANWLVPAWDGAKFNADGVAEVFRPIL